MERRSLLSLLGFSGITALLGDSLAQPLLGSTSKVREVTIRFPENSDFEKFQKDLPQWMDLPAWKAFLETESSKKSIVDLRRTVFEDRVVYRYQFRNYKDLILFRLNAQSAVKIDLSKLESLGYSESVKIS